MGGLQASDRVWSCTQVQSEGVHTPEGSQAQARGTRRYHDLWYQDENEEEEEEGAAAEVEDALAVPSPIKQKPTKKQKAAAKAAAADAVAWVGAVTSTTGGAKFYGSACELHSYESCSISHCSTQGP